MGDHVLTRVIGRTALTDDEGTLYSVTPEQLGEIIELEKLATKASLLENEIKYKHSHLEPLYKILEDMPDWEVMEFSSLIEYLRDKAQWQPMLISYRPLTVDDADPRGYVEVWDSVLKYWALWTWYKVKDLGDQWAYWRRINNTPPE